MLTLDWLADKWRGHGYVAACWHEA